MTDGVPNLGPQHCQHEATGTFVQHHCRDCGSVYIDGVWCPAPEEALDERARAAEAEVERLRGRVENLTASRENITRNLRDQEASVRARLREVEKDARVALEAVAEISAPLLRADLLVSGGTSHEAADAVKALIANRDALQRLVYVQWSDVLLPDPAQLHLLAATLRAANPNNFPSVELGFGVPVVDRDERDT